MKKERKQIYIHNIKFKKILYNLFFLSLTFDGGVRISLRKTYFFGIWIWFEWRYLKFINPRLSVHPDYSSRPQEINRGIVWHQESMNHPTAWKSLDYWLTAGAWPCLTSYLRRVQREISSNSLSYYGIRFFQTKSWIPWSRRLWSTCHAWTPSLPDTSGHSH